MDISVIIVSWKVRDLLEKCLGSIFIYTAGCDFEVIVVDNASEDGTAEMVNKKFPQAKFIQNKENLGFAKANNIGIKQAKGRSILLLNPDTELIENTLGKTVEKMRSLEGRKVGILGCRLLNADRSLQPSVRRFPGVFSQAVILLKLHHIFLSLLDNYLAKYFNYEKEAEVDQVMGAFFCISRQCLEKVGILDEGYFIWFEEVDYCRRAQRTGYKVLYWPGTSVIHYGGQSFNQQMTWRKQIWFFRSALRYFKNNFSQ